MIKKLASPSLILSLALGMLLASCGRHKLSPEELQRNRYFAEIIKRADQRALGDDLFLEDVLAGSGGEEVSVWSASALAGIGSSRSLPWLYRALKSPCVSVRAASAFAIGEIEDRELLLAEGREADPAARTELIRALDDSAPAVRMRAIEALGKTGSRSEAREIIKRLVGFRYDGSPAVRGFLSLAITALVRLNDTAAIPMLHELAGASDPEMQWRVANALYRMRDKTGQAIFLRLLQSPNPDVTAHAARGLGICEAPELADGLTPLLMPHYPDTGGVRLLSVRVSALQALGNLKNPRSIPAIDSAVKAVPINGENPDQVNFAIQAAAALGNIGAIAGLNPLQDLLPVPGPVRNAAIAGLAKILKPDPARFFELTSSYVPADAAGKRARAQALGMLGGAQAARELEGMLADTTDVTVLPAVLQALGRTEVPHLDNLIEPSLRSTDGVVLGAAIETYKPPTGTPAPWRRMVLACQSMPEGMEPPARVAGINRLEPWLREPEVQVALRAALRDRSRNVRISALRLLRLAKAADLPPDPGPAETRLTDSTYHLVAAARRDRTIAVISTPRGAIEVELFREDAPLTVDNFVFLARQGFYDGLTFMRVVPYFVIQGGDPRSDQEGGPGYSIRCEINTRPFERGSVGMALSGKDTGGSQFFITLSAQPHLDGSYTCFGRVISGMPVAERITPGDLIQTIRIKEDVTFFDHRRF